MSSKQARPKPGIIDATCSPAVVASVQQQIDQLNLPAQGRAYMRQVVAAPSRREGGGGGNWHGFTPSQKMGATIGHESRRLEHAASLLLESQEDCLAYFNQGEYLKIEYVLASGKRGGFRTRPDRVAVRTGRFELIECKQEAWLERRAKEQPNLYRKVGGIWTCPPAQAAARAMGMEYIIWTERDVPAVLVANLEFLQDYRPGALTKEQSRLHAEAGGLIREAIAQKPGVTIFELLNSIDTRFDPDALYRSIQHGQVAADLLNDDLSDQRRCRLYASKEVMLAYRDVEQSRRRASDWFTVNHCGIEVGATLQWDGRHLKILNVGSTEITVLGDEGMQHLPRAAMHKLLEEGRMVQNGEHARDMRAQQAYLLLQGARDCDLQQASDRYRRILHCLTSSATAGNRTERRWLEKYKHAEAALGCGFVGLLNKSSLCGNRAPRLPQLTLEIVAAQIDAELKTPRNLNAKRVWEHVRDMCVEKNTDVPSYQWFCKHLKTLNPHQLKRAREGEKAAYYLADRIEPHLTNYRPEDAHPFGDTVIDHTEVDLELRCSKRRKKLGKAWLTLLISVPTRRVLAWHLSFEEPSYRSVLAVLTDCVRRHGRLPASISIDGGPEFKGIWFESRCAFFSITVHRRPSARPRFSSEIERLFGSLNTMFFHCLAGNTQLRKNIRQVVPWVDPDNFSVWTLSDLRIALEEFLTTVYDEMEHSGLHESPRTCHERLMQTLGTRPERRIAFDRDFIVTMFPTTRKGEARVQVDGVKINCIYYNSSELACQLGKSLPVRYDPRNLAIAYARVGLKWVQLRSKYFSDLFRRTEVELHVAAEEWKRRGKISKKTRFTQRELVDFLRRMRGKEDELLELRKAAEERDDACDIPVEDVLDDGDEAAPDPEKVDVPMVESASPQSTKTFDSSAVVTGVCEEY